MISWDLFCDEQKDGSVITDIGILAIEKGVVAQFTQVLLDRKNKREGTGCKIATLHWNDLKNVEAKLACDWITCFLGAPLAFFIYIQSSDKKMTKYDLIKATIERLEKDEKLPEGLDRRYTTVQLDYDSADARNVDIKLCREFGLLRAFSWDDKGSPLLQLTDLLLGASTVEVSRKILSSSNGDQNRKLVIDHIYEKTREYSTQGKNNWIMAYDLINKPKRLFIYTRNCLMRLSNEL